MDLEKILIEVQRDRVIYSKQIERLKSEGKETSAIEKVVNKCIDNITDGITSFVIFGEPQCGKTELMICLSAKLIETTNRLIIILVNDNVNLLEQNTNRFLTSRITPKPKTLNEFLEEEASTTRIVICKKNHLDLEKLVNKTNELPSKIIILDDEADFATPNGKVNKQDKTKINKLIGDLLIKQGIYIGITATPARLDLNNTFGNNIDRWIHFESHSNYVGKEIFFPTKLKELPYRLEFINDETPSEEQLEKAILSFIVNVAIMNIYVNNTEGNYAFLVHTSGSKIDHQNDLETVRKVFDILSNFEHPNFRTYINRLENIIKTNIDKEQHDITKIIKYILTNITNNLVVKVNSDRSRNNINIDFANDLPNLFTIPIGGNKVSRGLTISNLLGMYFTRDAKRMQQDTYIQRARMFGNRQSYLKKFQLWIPEKLFLTWRNCFIYHDFATESIKSGSGVPAWISDEKVYPVSSNSIDRKTINIESNEISFDLFTCTLDNLQKILDFTSTPFETLNYLNKEFGEECLPSYILKFVNKHSENLDDIHITCNKYKYQTQNRTTLESLNKNEIQHKFKIHFYQPNSARISYSFFPKKIKYLSKQVN